MITNVKHIISLMLVLAGSAKGYETNLVPHVNEGDGAYAVESRADQAVWVAERNLYFQLPGDLPTNSPSVYVEIVYYDESAGPRLTLQYDSLNNVYAFSTYHTRSSCVGTMAFEKSYHRLDQPSFGRRGRQGFWF